MTAAIVVGVLVAAGAFLVLQKELVRSVLGFMLLGHAANVVLLSAGGLHRREPALLGEGVPTEAADPLPQAFALTAIVITFAVTVYLLVLALRTREQDDGPPGSALPDAPAADPAPQPRSAASGGSGPEEDAR